MLKKFKDWFFYNILRKKYYRSGHCLGCGRCCEKIYVKHGKSVLTDASHFFKLKSMHNFYNDLELLGKDENGLIFACKNLDKESRKCKIHPFRSKICRSYPQEEIFMMGGDMARTCGYKFTPIYTFEEILRRQKKRVCK